MLPLEKFSGTAVEIDMEDPDPCAKSSHLGTGYAASGGTVIRVTE